MKANRSRIGHASSANRSGKQANRSRSRSRSRSLAKEIMRIQ
jgi:hypothetical protein